MVYTNNKEKKVLSDFLFKNTYKFQYGKSPKLKEMDKNIKKSVVDSIVFFGNDEISNTQLKSCDFILCSNSKKAKVQKERIDYYIVDSSRDEELKKSILTNHENIYYALSYNYPGFRNIACNDLIPQIALQNALWASGTAAPNVVSGVHQLVTVPIEAASDFVVLTINEIRMAFMLSGLCGNSVGFLSQIDDIGIILGVGASAKALSTNLAGKIPVGAGIILKGAISYSFTWAIGEALILNQMTGKKITRKFITDLAKKLLEESKRIVGGYIKKFNKKAK